MSLTANSTESSSPSMQEIREIRKLARETFINNKEMNAAKRKSDATRKQLYKEMKDHGLESFDFETTIDGEKFRLTSEIGSRNITVIDVNALRSIVDDDTFMKICSASQKSVVEHAGTEVLTRCSTSKRGSENVTVSPTK